MSETTTNELVRDVVVIGGGAAGLSAALLLSRARLHVAVVDAGMPRNASAAHTHNFLSRDGLPPGELLAAGRAEFTAYGGELVRGIVETVKAFSPGFGVQLAGGDVLRARRLLVTTGVRDVLPPVPGLADRWGRDVLQCPYCHGHEVRDEPLGVLATAPVSVHRAELVRQWSDDVVLFEHTYSLSEIEREQLAALDIRIVSGEVQELQVHDDGLRGIRTADGCMVPRAALFIDPQYLPGSDALTELGCMTSEGGFLVVDENGATSVPGVWAAGNVVNPKSQLITVAGSAAAAATAMHVDLVTEQTQYAVERQRDDSPVAHNFSPVQG